MRPRRQYRSIGSDCKYDYNNNRNDFKGPIAVSRLFCMQKIKGEPKLFCSVVF